MPRASAGRWCTLLPSHHAPCRWFACCQGPPSSMAGRRRSDMHQYKVHPWPRTLSLLRRPIAHTVSAFDRAVNNRPSLRHTNNRGNACEGRIAVGRNDASASIIGGSPAVRRRARLPIRPLFQPGPGRDRTPVARKGREDNASAFGTDDCTEQARAPIRRREMSRTGGPVGFAPLEPASMHIQPMCRRIRLRARRRQRQHRVDRLGVARGAQLLGDVLVAQQAGDARQRLEVIGAGAFGREQQEDRDRPAGRPSPRNRSGDRGGRTGRTSSPAWAACRAEWRRRSRPRWCRASPAAAAPRTPRVRSARSARQALRREFLQRLLLAVDLQCRENRLGCDQIGNRHWDVSEVN